MQTQTKAACILALGMVIMGESLRSGIQSFGERDRKVVVKGLSEREMKADKVTWPLIYKELGNDPSAMYELLAAKNQKVVDFLKAAGLKDEEISVNPPTIRDRQADNYGNEIMNFRYKATSVITVTSSDVDKVRTLMNRQTELMRQGIAIVSEEYGENSIQYDFTGLNEIKPQMVEEATKNARATAEKFAQDSRSKLGKIRTASQGQFSIDNRDANTPYIKRIRVVNTVEHTPEQNTLSRNHTYRNKGESHAFPFVLSYAYTRPWPRTLGTCVRECSRKSKSFPLHFAHLFVPLHSISQRQTSK